MISVRMEVSTDTCASFPAPHNLLFLPLRLLARPARDLHPPGAAPRPSVRVRGAISPANRLRSAESGGAGGFGLLPRNSGEHSVAV